MWLVAARYDPQGPSLAGRLLSYCDNCRAEMGGQLGTVLPLAVLRADPDAVLCLLYRHGATGSDPDQVAASLDVPRGAWLETARAAVQS